MKTLTFAAALAAGYVLGTRAGREKYEQIVQGARKVGTNPTVMQAQAKAKDLIDAGTSAVTSKINPSSTRDAATQPIGGASTPSSRRAGQTPTASMKTDPLV